MVEQSMKRRSEARAEGERGGRGGLRMLWKTFLTWEGSGRTVIITSCALREQLVMSLDRWKDNCGIDNVRGLALMWDSNQGKSCVKQAPNLDH